MLQKTQRLVMSIYSARAVFIKIPPLFAQKRRFLPLFLG
jgi:hypothetical protein